MPPHHSAASNEVKVLYHSIPADLQQLWDHVQVEAALHGSLQEVDGLVQCLKATPQTYDEIQKRLMDLDILTKFPGVLEGLSEPFQVDKVHLEGWTRGQAPASTTLTCARPPSGS